VLVRVQIGRSAQEEAGDATGRGQPRWARGLRADELARGFGTP
jgi:hypothetical protein